MKMQELTLKLTTMMFLSVCILFAFGCVDEPEDDSVPLNSNEGTGGERNDDEIPFDTDVDPNASFDFDLSGLPYVGVNMSGPEWDGGASQTKWPDQYLTQGYASYLQWYRGWGMTTVRLPFKWEYIQPELDGPLDAEELRQLKITVFHLRDWGAKVLIDMHNYARYGGDLIGSEEVSYQNYVNVWRQLAAVFKPYPEVLFGIMNEPHTMPTSQWVTAANAAIAGIRAEGAQNLIFINGNGWSGAHSWYQTWTDSTGEMSNADAMLQIVDPLDDDHLVFEVHQYLDEISSDWGVCQCSTGEMRPNQLPEEHPVPCTNETVGSYRMYRFTQWLKENNKKGFLGEFGVEADATCIAALNDHLKHIEDNQDVYVGWTWWSAGPGCSSWQRPIDPFCWADDRLESLADDGVNGSLIYPQLKTLVDHLSTY